MSLIAPPVPTDFDLKQLASCDSSVRFRRLVELAIVRHLIQALLKAGHVISVDDGGDEDAISNSKDVDAIMDAAFGVDDCYLHVSADDDAKKRIGWVRLVYGNDGWDVINDNTINLEQLLAATTEYAEKLSEWF